MTLMPASVQGVPEEIRYVTAKHVIGWLAFGAFIALGSWWLSGMAVNDWYGATRAGQEDSALAGGVRLTAFIVAQSVAAACVLALLGTFVHLGLRLWRHRGKSLVHIGDDWLLRRPSGDLAVTADDLCAAQGADAGSEPTPEWWADLWDGLNRPPLRHEQSRTCASRRLGDRTIRFRPMKYYRALAVASVLALLVYGIAQFTYQFGPNVPPAFSHLWTHGSQFHRRLIVFNVTVLPALVLGVVIWRLRSVLAGTADVVQVDESGIKVLRGDEIRTEATWSQVKGLKARWSRWGLKDIDTLQGAIRVPNGLRHTDLLWAIVEEYAEGG